MTAEDGLIVRFSIGAATDVGRVRSVNQDAHLVRPALVAVADGMGGHRGGEVASKIAVDTLEAAVGNRSRSNTTPARRSMQSLAEGVTAANDEILRRAADDPDLHGMGTTMCAVAVIDDGDSEVLGVVNVGDSRVYRFSHGRLEQLTEDHSLVESMVREGRLTPAEAEVHPQRNIVTRALGASDAVDVDDFVLAAESGDRYLLCSDGLTNEVSFDEISSVLGSMSDPNAAAEALVAAANSHGGRDNITAVIVDVELVDIDEFDGDVGTDGDDTDGEDVTDTDGHVPVATADRAGSAESKPEPAPTPVSSDARKRRRWRFWRRG